MKGANPWSGRPLVWAAGGLGLLAIGYAAEKTRPYPTMAEILARPDRYHGKLVPLIGECRVEVMLPDGFVIRQMGARMRARTSAPDAHPGDDVVVEGTFRAPDSLEVTRLRIAAGRRWKMAISVVPVMVIGFLLRRNIGVAVRSHAVWLRLRTDA